MTNRETKTEILWNNDETRDFLEDLKSFVRSLDFCQKIYNLEKLTKKEYIFIADSTYRVSSETAENAFQCPVCKNIEFDVLEGVFEDKPVLGLACLECETYGAVFPNGM